MSRDSKKAGEAFSTLILLDPGFRFHPTDEELVNYYLKKKVLNKPMRYDVIDEIDIYKHEPWDLTDYSKLKTRDQEWFFFSSGACVNRATKEGYWKRTEDKAIRGGNNDSIIGMIKILEFYSGFAPEGFRTNWLMHQYHLVENEHELDSYVLCRVFLKQDEDDVDDVDDSGSDVIFSVPFVEETKRINESQQENYLQSKILIDLTELSEESESESESDDEPLKRSESDDEPLKRSESDDEPLKRESTVSLSLIQNKRVVNSNISSQTTKDHCFSTEKIIDTYAIMEKETETKPVATIVPVTACSYTKMINDLKNENKIELVSSSFSTKMINDLMKKKQEMVIDTEKHNIEMKKVKVMIKVLRKKIDTLLVENKELKKKISLIA